MAKRRRQSPLSAIVAALVAFAIALVLFVIFADRLFPPATPERSVVLYYSDETGKALIAQKHTIRQGSLEQEIEATLKALIRQPPPPAIGTIPRGTRLISVKVKGDTAYVDFSSQLVENHPGGSSAELQTIYSIVNTVVLNFKQIKYVQILIEGRRKRTLKGHIIIEMPLAANRKLIAR